MNNLAALAAMALALGTQAQSWCPSSAAWYFDIQFGTTTGYALFAYNGDSVVGGRNAKVIDHEGHYFNSSTQVTNHYDFPKVITALDSGVLYIWHGQGEWYEPYWDTLVWFGAVPGDYWEVLQPEDFSCSCGYTVTDTGHVNIAGLSLRYVQTTSDCVDLGLSVGLEDPMFIERFGGVHDIFLDECQTPQLDTTLRCYQDVDITYMTTIAPTCDLIVGTGPGASSGPVPLFTFFHDPVEAMCELRLGSPTTDDLRWQLLDASGRQHVEAIIPRGTSMHRIGTAGMAAGLYTLRVCDAKAGCQTVKWVRQ